MLTANQRINRIAQIATPQELFGLYPLEEPQALQIAKTRRVISDILYKRDDRLLVVVGPCSIHDGDAALEYAEKLLSLREAMRGELEIVMRVYFEKPRTTVGWKGLINDPDLNGSFNVDKGLALARKLLLELSAIGMPAGCEFLDIVTGQYYADLVSWGAVGARTTESQVHREMASGLSCPVGFKNGTNGNLEIAADAVVAAKSEHVFLSPTDKGQTALFSTAGNLDAHIILRGGTLPNYDANSVQAAVQVLANRNIKTGVMIDFSHANSQKQHRKQIEVASDVAGQLVAGCQEVVACMIESNLVEGKQAVQDRDLLVYGQSITDACIDFEQTRGVITQLAEAVVARRSAGT